MKIKLGRDKDLWYVSYPWGKTVVKHNGAWKTVVSPQDSFLQECTDVFRGGYDTPVTDAQAAELTAAGYGEYIVEL